MLLERQEILRANVRHARIRLGYEYRELAKKAGVGKTTLSNFETAGTNLGELTVNKLARVFGVEPDDLFDPGFRLRFQPTGPAGRTNNAPADSTASTEVTLNDKEDDEARQIYDIARGLDEAKLRSLVDYARFLATQEARSDSADVVYRKPRRGEA